MKHLFIINPAAGKCDRSAELTEKINACCKPRGLCYEIRISAGKGDCAALARAAAETGEEYRIYACGGDGTLNEVVNGVAGFSNVAVTHFPVGSGNDFVRMFSRPEAFSRLEQLLDPEERLLDLISVGDRAFSLNICSMGIDARIGAEVARYKRLPGLSGSGAYKLSTLVNVIKGVHRPCEVEVEDQVLRGEQTLICVCNGRYYGGGFCPVPEARPDDGLLEVLVIRGVSRLTAARVIGRYKNGRWQELPRWISHYQVKALTLRFPEESVVNVDGEIITAKDVTFAVAPEKLRFFHPRGLDFGEFAGK